MKNSLLLFLCLFLCVALLAQTRIGDVKGSNTYAVIIGISDYQDPEIADLKYSAQDARSFAAFLKSEAGGELENTQIRLLTNEQATSGKMNSALLWLLEVGNPGDKAFVYFAGYGNGVEPNPERPSFWMPYDAPSSIFMAGAFPYLRFKRALSNWAKVRNIDLLILTDSYLLDDMKEPVKKELIKYVSKDTSSVYEMSISADNVPHFTTSSYIKLNERVTYTSLLLEGLIGLADEDKNHEINLLEAGNYVSARVPYQVISNGMLYFLAKEEDTNVATVHPDVMKDMKKKNHWLPPIARLEADGYENSLLAKVDTATRYLYQDFIVAIELNNLLHPPGNSANDLLAQIEQSTDVSKFKNAVRRKLTAALQDETQQAINAYLKTDSKELALRWAYRDHYNHFPDYLARAAELIGERHYLYKALKAKQYYFKGLTIRLEAEALSKKEIVDKKMLYQNALDIQHLALSYEDQAAFIYNELGVIHSQLENWDSSILFLNQATEWAPRWSIPWSNLSLVYGNVNQYDEGIRCGLEAIRVETKDVNAYNNVGIIYLKKKEYGMAERYFKLGIEMEPTASISYYNLACSKSLRGNRQSALKWLEEAVEVGYNDFKNMSTDKDLDNIRNTKRFVSLMSYASK